ncbi:MAG TPA: hypothetical protein VGE15_02530, partial [Sphingobacteriaceae bacterium]
NKQMRPVLKYTLSLSFLFMAAQVSGQVKENGEKPEQKAVTEEIEVVRPYKPVLADAVKIRRSPDMNTKEAFKPALTYNILDKRLELNSEIRQLEAQQMPEERPPFLKNNFARIGAGNLNTALGELYINTGADEGLQAGMFARHLSQSGDVNKQQVSRQEFGIFGRSIGDAVTYAGRLSYDRRSTFFYGVNPVSSAVADPAKQRFNTLEAEGEMYNNYSEDDRINFGLKANAYTFGNIAAGKENALALNGYFNTALNQFNLGFNVSTDFTASKDSLYTVGNNVLRGNPYLKLKGNGFLLELGLNMIQEFGDRSRTHVFPAASVEVPVAAEYAILFAGLKGDVMKSSIREFSYDNPFLNSNISLRNAVEKANIYGGIKGNAGGGFGFKVMAYYKKIEDMPLFVNNAADVSRFDVVYDEETKVMGIEGEMSIKATDVFTLTGKAQANNYKLSTQEEAWFKPGFRLSGNGRASINKKLALDAEIVFNGDVYGRIPGAPAPGQVPAGTIVMTRIKGFADLSAGAEYQVNSNIGVYLRGNNLFGTKYQQYLYYPKFGMNILGGFHYSF